MVKKNGTAATLVTTGVNEAAGELGQSCLVVFYGQNFGNRYFLDKGKKIIGRSDSAQIRVDQESVSRKHARIVSSGEGRWHIMDLGSTNGTFVNDQRIVDTELRDGDMVRIGQTIFKYLSGTNIESKYHEEIYRLTNIDGLTQVYNKRFLLQTLEREFDRALRYSRLLSLVMLDIDHFKQINDTHGHLAGDYILREISGIILHHIRRMDVFARYGGEEFGLILPETDLAHALQICEKLRQMIESYRFSFGGKDIQVTVSFGVAVAEVRSPDHSLQDFIACADAKLYEAKQAGRNCVAV